MFDLKPSYYTLFKPPQVSWQTTQKPHPKEYPNDKKPKIIDWLETHRPEIISGKLVGFVQDKYPPLSGDLSGYVWGKTKKDIVLSPSQGGE